MQDPFKYYFWYEESSNFAKVYQNYFFLQQKIHLINNDQWSFFLVLSTTFVGKPK